MGCRNDEIEVRRKLEVSERSNSLVETRAGSKPSGQGRSRWRVVGG